MNLQEFTEKDPTAVDKIKNMFSQLDPYCQPYVERLEINGFEAVCYYMHFKTRLVSSRIAGKVRRKKWMECGFRLIHHATDNSGVRLIVAWTAKEEDINMSAEKLGIA